MLPTQEIIDQLAERIERAYALRRPGWYRGCSTRRVWAAAALRLWQAHVDGPELPLDSELFVASQPISGCFGDPWSELTQPEAARRYRSQVRRIIRQLETELRREVRLVERRFQEDSRITPKFLASNRSFSPLGCYIAAQRLGRPELARRFTRRAAEQHRSCPLYQWASLSLLPAELYPAEESLASPDVADAPRISKSAIVMN